MSKPKKSIRSTGLPLVIQSDAQLAIVGSFPGVASLQAQEYYALPRNQFWPIVGTLLGQPNLKEFEYTAKLAFLKTHKVALWDVYKACERKGSLDANIKAGEPNDLKELMIKAPHLKVIGHNGKASAKYQNQAEALGVEVVVLPSSSPAFASMRFEQKLEAWRVAFVLAGVIKG